jgi:hypothetical protein
LITYVDSSVLLRVIQGQPGAWGDWPTIEPVSSQLITVECLRAIDRARLRNLVDETTTARDRASVMEALAAFRLAPIDDAVLSRAADPFPTSVGSLDAIHLATALVLRVEYPELQFATHDAELGTAARAMGFAVLGA